MENPVVLTAVTYESALDDLGARDQDLRRVMERCGRPEQWSREPGFPTLVLTILEQQVSVASARATFDRLVDGNGPPTPDSFLQLDADSLRGAGFSRQKTRYCRALAEAVREGTLDLSSLATASDGQARAELMKIVGIGRWTADVYLLSALRRSDVWPVGDIALEAALVDVKGLDGRPKGNDFKELGEPWRPWRSVAAQILWHHYLEATGGIYGIPT
jgi:DNA-3-methyladenine glycosylase II